jgi:hypothetical protein
MPNPDTTVTRFSLNETLYRVVSRSGNWLLIEREKDGYQFRFSWDQLTRWDRVEVLEQEEINKPGGIWDAPINLEE